MNHRVLLFGAVGVCAIALASYSSRDTDPLATSETPTAERRHASTSATAATWSLHAGHGDASGAWLGGQVMVDPGSERLEDIAADFDTEVVRPVGRAGVGALAVPRGSDAGAFIAALQESGRVSTAGPVGVVRGAGKGGKGGGGSTPPPAEDPPDEGGGSAGPCEITWEPSGDRASAYQWHLDVIGAPQSGTFDLSDVIVAVLDTGVAYEAYSDAAGTYQQAPSLASSAITAPYDFVNTDSHANDDHQHGTHVASLIASSGAVEGVAPGVGLMPLKVLDADNSGSELALVDAIYHAIDNGADIINMSLSFAEGYAPSPALTAALQAAADADIVLVAASGNDGADFTTYPAASPLVIAVGSSTMADRRGNLEVTDYGNRSPVVDLVAPGGDVEVDLDRSGVVDGLVAESIGLNDPSEVGLWLYAGTSQAAALVSGAAAVLLHAGSTPAEVHAALQISAQPLDSGPSSISAGTGAGTLRVDEATAAVCDGSATAAVRPRRAVAVLPVLARPAPGYVLPVAQLQVTDELGSPLAGVRVHVSLWGASSADLSCTSGTDGRCEVAGPMTPDTVTSLAWAFAADAVEEDDISRQPASVMFATDALEILVSALRSDSALSGGILAVTMPSTTLDDGTAVAESIIVVNSGTGLSSSPLGMVFSPPSLGGVTTDAVASVDLDGTGLSSSPLGQIAIRSISIDGTGLSSSPLGMQGFSLVAFDGVGLSSSPLGLGPLGLFTTDAGDAHDSDYLDFASDPMLMGSGTVAGIDASGTAIGQTLDDGGWTSPSGYPGAALLIGSGAIDITADSLTTLPTGAGAVAL